MSTALDNDLYHRSHIFTLPLPGSVIVSPMTGIAYEMGQQFDQGSFGHVFSCTDEWQNDLVAKVLKPAETWQLTEARALSEGVAMAIARSPNIVHVYDMFVYKGAFLIISERCDQSVRHMIARSETIPSVWFPALAKALLNALHWMHVNGIAHCDVHPGNVFLRFVPDAILPSESACAFKVGDFGLARLIQEMQPDDTFLNAFCPPEVIDAVNFGRLDHRADLYQAALTLLMFTEKKEFVLTQSEILGGRPRELAEALNQPWAEVLASMLRRHVDYRPPTALDAWRQLKPLLYTH
jgi:serine/threonine-protein kinase